MSIRRLPNELKVHEKTVRIAIKQDLSPEVTPWLRYMGRFSITNTTSHPNTCSLKTAIEKEGNKTYEEFILKTCKSLQRRVDTAIEKKMVAILTKFTVLCISSSFFFVYFLKSKLISFYDRVVYYHFRIFLNLLLHPVSCWRL